MTGPQGSVTPGQLMTYAIEYENVGSGAALGVYIKDILNPSLDDTALTVQSMYNVVYSSDGVPISTTTATFPWSYDPLTRTFTLLAGNADASAGGSFVLQARLKSTATPGTAIPNQAFVYFPNALQQITPTNTIVSAVPLTTQLTSVGASSGAYLSTASLTAQLAAAAAPVAAQPVNIQLLSTSSTTLTDKNGLASTAVFLSSSSGNYNLGMNYSGDGLYYLPSASNVNFTVSRMPTRLQRPFASARATDTVRLSLTLTDSNGQTLGHQLDEPKTVFLELLNSSGAATALSSSLLSGTSAYFQFALPQPLQLTWPIRARFADDSRYAGVVSSGTLNLIDDVPPTITINSPRGGEVFAGNSSINVNFSVQDNADLSPQATGYLLASDGSQALTFTNGAAVPISSLSPGSWTFLVTATDWAGNLSTAATPSFQVTSDVLPPQTSLIVGSPSFGANPIFVSSQTGVSIQAVDDRSTVGDGLGIGVAQIQYSIDGGSWTVYASPFVLTGEGQHHISFFSIDLAGNTESPKTALLSVDSTPPLTRLLVDGVASSSSSIVLISTDALSFSTSDAGSGVAQTLYALDGSTTESVTVSTFSLNVGTHTLSFQSVDNVGNLEALNSVFALVRSSNTTPPNLTLIPANGSTVTTSAPLIAAVYIDTGTGISTSSVHLALDGVDVTALSFVTLSSASFAPVAALSQGTHTVTASVADIAGNTARSTSTFFLDSIPPQTTLVAGAPQFSTTTLFIATATPLGLAVSEPARTFYAVDSSSFATYSGTFTLVALGTHTVQFYSIDLAGNVEVARSSAVAVDGLPPVTQLLIGAPSVSPSSTTLVGPATVLSLSAQDPPANGVSSGVKDTYLAFSTGAFALAPATFTLSGVDGARLLSFYSRDEVLNAEAVKTASVSLDATPPVTTLSLSGGRQFQDLAGFYASSDTRLVLSSTDPVVNGVASGVAFTRWQDNGGAFTTYVSSLALAAGAHVFAYQSSDNVSNLEVLRSATMFVDTTPPISAVAIGSPTYTAADGTIYVATMTPVSFTADDPALTSSTVAGPGVNRIEVSFDGAAFVAVSSPVFLAEGRHAILYRAVDELGNVETAHSISLQSDATPPASSLAIGSPQLALSSMTVLVSSLTPIGIVAADPVSNNVASGVGRTFYQVNGGTWAVYAASFTLAGADGPQSVSFYSQDNVLNMEAVKAGTVVLDATPPEAALLSPATCDSGLCRVVKGKFPVLGTARDLHFASYVLDYAAGQNAATGYTLIGSGSAAVSSATLAAWDASALSGWQTLRLTATDLVGNVSVVLENVFVGDPGELLILGNDDVFDMPQGVAGDSFGNIYVADTNANRIAVFTATGAFSAAYGQAHGDRDDMSKVSTSTVWFNKPKGVALDAAGNIYAADTNNDRVLKLSATGQLLLALGRQAKDGKDRDAAPRFQPGKGPGEFNKPSGVALDAAGNIYVADTNNNRVQVLTSTGAFRLAFSLPPLPVLHADEKEDHDDDQPALGRPFGIAVDAAGKIYVADPAGGRALVYGATGQLLLSVPITGTTKDGRASPGRPEGVAVSTDGYCLLVSDRKFDRVLKFDALGDATLAFGAMGRLDDDKPAPGIVLRKPVGLALAPDGTLLVADRNNDRVERFGLPTGKPASVVPPNSGDDPRFVAKDVLDSASGGTVARSDKAGVAIPPGALPDDLKITVSTMSSASAAQADSMGRVAGGKGMAPASAPVEYGPEGTQFATPVTITVPYDAGMVAASGMSEDSLKVNYWNKDKGDWETLESTVDKTARTVTAKTPHFSLYQVLGSTGTGTIVPLAIADPTFTFHDAYAFPNPVRGTSVVTIRMQTGLADSVEVHAYDVTGRRVYSSSNFTLNPALDDGNGKGAQYTYDNVWDISGVGSGVYTYVLTAKKAGASDIHKSGRIGVVK